MGELALRVEVLDAELGDTLPDQRLAANRMAQLARGAVLADPAARFVVCHPDWARTCATAEEAVAIWRRSSAVAATIVDLDALVAHRAKGVA